MKDINKSSVKCEHIYVPIPLNNQTTTGGGFKCTKCYEHKKTTPISNNLKTEPMEENKEKHFRIIELPCRQVLLKLRFGQEDDEPDHIIDICFFHDGVEANLKLGFDDSFKANKMFVEFTNNQAQDMVDSVTNMFN